MWLFFYKSFIKDLKTPRKEPKKHIENPINDLKKPHNQPGTKKLSELRSNCFKQFQGEKTYK